MSKCFFFSRIIVLFFGYFYMIIELKRVRVWVFKININIFIYWDIVFDFDIKK